MQINLITLIGGILVLVVLFEGITVWADDDLSSSSTESLTITPTQTPVPVPAQAAPSSHTPEVAAPSSVTNIVQESPTNTVSESFVPSPVQEPVNTPDLSSPSPASTPTDPESAMSAISPETSPVPASEVPTLSPTDYETPTPVSSSTQHEPVPLSLNETSLFEKSSVLSLATSVTGGDEIAGEETTDPTTIPTTLPTGDATTTPIVTITPTPNETANVTPTVTPTSTVIPTVTNTATPTTTPTATPTYYYPPPFSSLPMSLSIEDAELSADATMGDISDITLTLLNLAPTSSQAASTLILEPANLQARMSGQITVSLERAGSDWLSDESLYPLSRSEGTYLVTFPLTIPSSPGSYLYAYYPKQTLTNRYTGEQETVAAGSVIQFTLTVTPEGKTTVTSA